MSNLETHIRLNLATSIGPNKLRDLVAYFGDYADILQASCKDLARFKLPEKCIVTLKQKQPQGLLETLDWLKKPQHHCLTLEDSDYPGQLRQISSPPPLIYIAGDPKLLNQPQIAIVGSRRCSPMGLELSEKLATELSQAGLLITSGMALGIDSAAHRGCLAIKAPTIAVLGSGLLRPYPHQHRKLFNKIQAQGTVISEFPLQSPPRRQHFPQRNRLISGLSLGILVVEAAIKSGSLITARFALEQNREVFAIPSSIHNPFAGGCHYLIQNGAKLVQSTKDILDELPSINPKLTICNLDPPKKNVLDKTHQLLLECVGFEPTSVDQLVNRSGLDPSDILSKLLILELNGYINAIPSGYLRVK
ncbi:MAG: DNA-processing protein DprA [Gammaproteobacteria bacterium]|nr:DNA-processing protein DprA [Gammaproteobacteria bacterium]